MNITSNNYAGNVSETVNFTFSGEKQEIEIENTGQTVLEFAVNDDSYEIQPNRKHNYFGYFTSCTLRSKKGLGTYSFVAVDSVKQTVATVQADNANLIVADISTRDAIPTEKRKVGLEVKVLSDGKKYELKNGTANVN